MWGPEDTFSRWLQFLCGIASIGLIVGIWEFVGFFDIYGSIAMAGLGYLAARCLWYAATGRNNLNNLDN